MSGQNLFAFAFSPPSGVLPKILPKITRADMGLHLPRLDDPCVYGPDAQDPTKIGLQDPAKKQALNVLIEKYKAVYVVGGQIVSTKLTKGKGDEPGVRFVGQFKALVNPIFGGAIYVSARCHVPKFFEEVLYTNVLNAQKADNAATLEFLIGIGLKAPNPTKPSITGYEWTVEPLVDMSAADDPVDLLFSRAKERVALAAPTMSVGEPSSAGAPTNGAVTVSGAESAPQPEAKEARGRNHRGSHAS